MVGNAVHIDAFARFERDRGQRFTAALQADRLDVACNAYSHRAGHHTVGTGDRSGTRGRARGEGLSLHRAKLIRHRIGEVGRRRGRPVGGIRARDRERRRCAGHHITVARRQHRVSGHAVGCNIVDEEDIVGTCALRAVRRAGDQRSRVLARLAQRHGGRAAAVQADRADAAQFEQFLSELRGGQARARGLVAVNLIQYNRAVRLDADRTARAGGGSSVDTRSRDRAVIDQQLAADRIIHVRPVAVVCRDRERHFFADCKVGPGRDVGAVRLGQHHLIVRNGKRGVARALADHLQLDRTVYRDRGVVHAFEDNIGAVRGEVGRIVIVAVEQVRARGCAGLVEVGDRNRAARAGDRHAHGRAAHDCGAVRFEADRILPGIG